MKAAEGGTLFLDEIGELPLEIQPKLLRLLQEREYERVGDPKPRKANVRVIAATNRRLEDLVKEGKFREDLYYRLNVISIELPPLRQRPLDITTIAHQHLKIFSRQNPRPIKDFTPAAMSAIQRYPWPGNLRELRNVIERAVILAPGEKIDVNDFPDNLRGSQPAGAIIGNRISLEELERRTHSSDHRDRQQHGGSRANPGHRPGHALPETQALRRTRRTDGAGANSCFLNGVTFARMAHAPHTSHSRVDVPAGHSPRDRTLFDRPLQRIGTSHPGHQPGQRPGRKKHRADETERRGHDGALLSVVVGDQTESRSDFSKARQSFQDAIDEENTRESASADEKKLIAKLTETYKAYATRANAFIASAVQDPAWRPTAQKLGQDTGQLLDLTDQLAVSHEQALTAGNRDTSADINDTIRSLMLLMIVAVIVAIYASFRLSSGLLDPLVALAKSIQQVGQGNLEQEVSGVVEG